MIQIRTRIAPSPTGEDLHIGNVYTTLINYVFALKHKGDFIIRIEDTDQVRLVKGSEQRILASLKWLGIEYKEGPDRQGPYGPYRQSERFALYKKYAEELIKKGYAYYCFCTPERLAKMRWEQQKLGKPPIYDGQCRELKTQNSKLKVKKGDKYTIRLKVPKEGVTVFKDLIRGEINFENKLIDDQVLLKSDGFPTYHLGVVVDDYLMKISHVIRAEEWISSTPKHILLYQFLGWKLPSFAHLPLLRNPDKSKLSKRKNPVWISWYREQGFLPEAILNYLATLGWSVPQELIEQHKKEGKPEELFSLSDMIKYFDLSHIKTTAPIFDLTKLEWMNGEYIRKYQISNIKYQIYEFFKGKYPLDMIEMILPLVQERIKTLKEFDGMCEFFVAAPEKYEEEISIESLKKVSEKFSSVPWRHDVVLSKGREIADELKVPFKRLAMDIRIAITGKKIGPPLFESMEVLGREESLVRLRNAVQN